MDVHSVYELIGYIASALVAISLMMSSILRLRVINLVGAACFTVYGLLIGAYPVAVVNFIIVLIDLYFLYEIFATDEYFALLAVSNDSEYLKYFLRFYEKEIKRYFPDFSFRPTESRLAFFVLRNLVPAGIFIGESRDKELLFVELDFAIPGYRDFKVDRFVYSENSDFFRKRGFRKLMISVTDKKHKDHLRGMGFVPESTNSNVYSFDLNNN